MKHILYLFIVFTFISCSKDPSSPEDTKEILPTQFYKFDVKTALSDKLQSTGAKSGLISYLKKSGWADNNEFREDYSLWITNLIRTRKSSNQVILDFNLELRTPAAFFDGDLIPGCRKHFTINYNLDEDVLNVSKPLTPAAILKGFDKVFAKVDNSPIKKIPYIGKYLETAAIFKELLNTILSFIDSGSERENQIEAFYVGLYSYDQVRVWILDIENSSSIISNDLEGIK